MAVYTNITTRLITLPDGTQCVPGQACEVPDDAASNQGFKDLVDSGDLVAGELSKEQRQQKVQERDEKAQQTQHGGQAQPQSGQQAQAKPQQTQPPQGKPTK